MVEQKPGMLKISGENTDKSLNGSHNLIVELMKAIAGIDDDDCIITEFKAQFTTIKNPDAERVEIEIDEGALQRQKLEKFFEKSERQKRGSWMDYFALKKFIDDAMYQFCMVYGKKCIARLLGADESKLLNGDTVSLHNLNHLLQTFDIRYTVLDMARTGTPLSKYVIWKLPEKSDEEDHGTTEYPCPEDHHMTDTGKCFDCERKMKCDIYATMLDER